ncbi:hypothetical protein SFC02_10230 [Terribacillus goriensis]|uniref:hypothetical protein n=1 Tax=Terribacillus saccharophilus TaxID=361277 RepID=UPI003983382B
MSLVVFYPNNSVEAEEYDENLSEEQEVEVLTGEEFKQYKAECMFNPEDTYEVVDSDENTFSIAKLRGYTGSTGDILVTQVSWYPEEKYCIYLDLNNKLK